MRALLDVNICISYLLAPTSTSPITAVVDAAVQSEYELLLASDITQELRTTVRRKEYLRRRISGEQMDTFVEILASIALTMPAIPEDIPSVSRDPKDDYLLALALIGEADYLVTGDNDLLVLSTVDTVQIVTAHEFARILREP